MSELPQRPMTAEPIMSTYLHRKGVAKGLPISGTFELTPRCNFDCKMCYIHQSEKLISPERRLREPSEWLEYARIAVEQGMVFLLITGGEPLVYPGFFELLSELKKLGLMISINTNGSLISGEILDRLLAAPPYRLNVTLYGASDETYLRLCGKPVFHQVVENLRAMKEAGLSVRLNASITPYNGDDLHGIFELAKEMGLHVKSTAYMFPPVRVSSDAIGDLAHRFTPSRAAEMMLAAREEVAESEEIRRSMAGSLREPPDDCEGEGVICRAGRSSLWITWDGRMLPCGMFPIDGWSLDEMSFDEAWREVRAYTAQIRLPKTCACCAYRPHCSVCAASCYAETGSFDQCPEYVCQMTQANYHLTKKKYGKDDPV